MQCDSTPQTEGNPQVDQYVFLKDGIMMYSGPEPTLTLSIDCVTQQGEYACQLGNTPAAGPQIGSISDAQNLTVNGTV